MGFYLYEDFYILRESKIPRLKVVDRHGDDVEVFLRVQSWSRLKDKINKVLEIPIELDNILFIEFSQGEVYEYSSEEIEAELECIFNFKYNKIEYQTSIVIIKSSLKSSYRIEIPHCYRDEFTAVRIVQGKKEKIDNLFEIDCLTKITLILLSRLHENKVIARTRVRYYENSQDTIKEKEKTNKYDRDKINFLKGEN